MRARAERLGGQCLLAAADGGGTRLTWTVPLGLGT
jgi:signal transduction histidine kinase